MPDKDIVSAAAEVAGSIPADTTIASDNLGQPATPPDEPLTGRQKLRLVGLVILKRLRFIAILAGRGPVHRLLGHGDELLGQVDPAAKRRCPVELEPGQEFYCPMDPQVVRSTYEPNGDVPKCPICGMPLSIRKKGGAGQAAGGHHRPGATLARAHPIGRHQDRAGRVPAGGQADHRRWATSRMTRAGCPGSSAGWTATWRSSTWTRPSPWSTRETRWRKSIAPNCTARPRSLVLATPRRGDRPIWRPPPEPSCCCWASASRKSTASWPPASRRRGW